LNPAICFAKSAGIQRIFPELDQEFRKEAKPMQAQSSNPTNGTEHRNQGVQPLPEGRLLAAAKRGRSEAFEALCQAHTARLLKTAFYITRNHEDAEDALQDSLLRAFVHLKSFDERSSFSTWLTRIVINSALMIHRRSRNARQVSADELSESGEAHVHLQIPDRSPNPEQRYMENERGRVLHKAIRNLRPRIRAVVEVGQLQELPMKEAARVLDISIAAAKGRLFHARAALRNSAALRAVAQARTEPAA
jgi:RNA polymerase sigma factor (sigma-70 family)